MTQWDVVEVAKGSFDTTRKGRAVWYGDSDLASALRRLRKHRKFDKADVVRVQEQGGTRRFLKQSEWPK